jgi:hypothetical protein
MHDYKSRAPDDHCGVTLASGVKFVGKLDGAYLELTLTWSPSIHPIMLHDNEELGVMAR